MSGTIDLGEVKLDTRKAQRDLNSLKDSLKAVQTDLDKAPPKPSEMFARLQQNLRGVGQAYKDVSDAAASFARIAGGVSGGVAVASALAVQFTRLEESSRQNAVALRSLGGAYNQIRAATGDTVTAQQAFQVQQRLTQSNLRVTGEQLAVIARAAREFALRTGTDATQAMDQLTSALASGDVQAMRPFGVSVQTGTLRTQAFRQALGQLQQQQRTTAASTTTTSEELTRLTTSFERLRDSMMQSQTAGASLRDVFREMADAVNSLADGEPLMQNFFASIVESIAPVLAALGGTGIHQGNAQDVARNEEQRMRENAMASIQMAQLRFPGLSLGFNASRLRGSEIQSVIAGLATARTRDEAQAILDHAGSASGAHSATAVRADQQRQAAAQPAADAATDREERLRGMSALDIFGMSEEQRQARAGFDARMRELQGLGINPSAAYRRRMYGLIAGFLNPMNRARFQREMSLLDGQARGLTRGGNFSGQSLAEAQQLYGAGLSNQQYLDITESMRAKRNAQAELDARFAPGRAGGYLAADGSETIFQRYSNPTYAITTEGWEQLAANEREKRAARDALTGAMAPGYAGRRRTADGTQTIYERFGPGLTSEVYQQIADNESGKQEARQQMAAAGREFFNRNDLSQQVGSFFSDTQTLAEKGAKGFENAFNTMSGSVSSFIDTLIEGQVPAGEAAVGLAKAALKGLAMQAVPEALFETAKGIAALAMGDPRAAMHFTAAGIYTAVGVAAGAAAAGISAAQRAGQAPSASASMSAGGFTSPGGSNASNERGSVVFNINSTVFDPERAEETVARLMAGANRRGL